MKPPRPERMRTPATAKPTIAQTGKLWELGATGIEAGATFFGVVVVVPVVGELAVVGEVVVSRVVVAVEVARCFGFFLAGGGALLVAVAAVVTVIVGRVVEDPVPMVSVVAVTVEVVSVVVSRSAAPTGPPEEA